MIHRRFISSLSRLPKAAKFNISQGIGGNKLFYNFESPIRNLLVTKKQGDATIVKAERELIQYVSSKFPQINIIVKGDIEASFEKSGNVYLLSKEEEQQTDLSQLVDLIITLGGDGTVIRTASLFKSRVPPMVSFAMGSLGFLLPFRKS